MIEQTTDYRYRISGEGVDIWFAWWEQGDKIFTLLADMGRTIVYERVQFASEQSRIDGIPEGRAILRRNVNPTGAFCTLHTQHEEVVSE